jgi:RND family efflux transporter MFP subunit
MLSKYTIRAPFDGYAVAEFTEVGAWLAKGDPVTEVIQLDPVELEVFVPERYVVAVGVGMESRVALEAIPGREFAGHVERVIPQADTRSRTFPVKIRLANPTHGDGHLLKSGMLARVVMAVGPPESALLAPKDALVLGGPTPRVFVVHDQGTPSDHEVTVRQVDVQLGVASGNLIQVKGQVDEGQRVVVQGNERLQDGQTVHLLSADGEPG